QQNPWLYFLKAQIAEARGNKAEAVEALRTARTLNRQKIAAETQATGVAPAPGPGDMPTSLTPGGSPPTPPPANPFRHSQSEAPSSLPPKAMAPRPASMPTAVAAPRPVPVATLPPAAASAPVAPTSSSPPAV